MEKFDCIMVGTGEIGMPLFELMNGVYKTLPINRSTFKQNAEIKANCDFLHVAIHGELPGFVPVVVDYFDRYQPKFIFIHSTVIPGTTDEINARIGKAVAIHCPVHGKHQGNCMKRDMLRYPKYLGVPENMDEEDVKVAKAHLSRMGFTTVISFPASRSFQSSRPYWWLPFDIFPFPSLKLFSTNFRSLTKDMALHNTARVIRLSIEPLVADNVMLDLVALSGYLIDRSKDYLAPHRQLYPYNSQNHLSPTEQSCLQVK